MIKKVKLLYKTLPTLVIMWHITVWSHFCKIMYKHIIGFFVNLIFPVIPLYMVCIFKTMIMNILKIRVRVGLGGREKAQI